MKRNRFLFFCLIFLLGAGEIQAQFFIVDSSQSHITISGTFDGMAFTTQGSGSLTTSYQGFVNATVTGPTIQFTGLSRIAAITNGVWKPAVGGANGSAPADFGAQVSIPLLGAGYGAGRNLVMDATSPVLALVQTNFDSSQLVVSMVTNLSQSPVLDYRYLLDSGTIPLSGRFTNTVASGSFLSTNGSVWRLVVQINATLSGTSSTLTMIGQIVATNAITAFTAPVITSVSATNQNMVLTVSNDFPQPQLLSSTNLTTWSPAGATITTNGGYIIFTTPMSGQFRFFRVQK